MTAYQLYKIFEKKFEEDPTAKDLKVGIVDGEWGVMEAETIKWRPKGLCTGKPMNMVDIE